MESLNGMDRMELSAVRSYATEEPAPLTTGNVSVQGTFCQKAVEAGTYIYQDGEFKAHPAADPVKGLNFYVQLTEEDLAKVSRVAVSFDPLPTGIRPVLSAGQAHDVYTLGGVRMKSGARDASDLQDLPQGIYIIGGKKTVRK